MKKILFLAVLVSGFPVLGAAQNNCTIGQQVPIQLMQQELKRNFKVLKKENPPIYYLSYIYQESVQHQLTATYGGISTEYSWTTGDIEVQARAGSPKMDNTRSLRGERDDWSTLYSSVSTPYDLDKKGFLASLWRLTNSAALKAQENFARVKNNVRNMAVNKDQSDDFVFPPVSLFCHEEPLQEIDLQKVKELLLPISQMTKGKKTILDSSFSFSTRQGHRYFVDSRGTQIKTPFSFIRLTYSLYGRGADGMEISRFGDYNLRSMADLPTAQKLAADVQKSMDELEALAVAPEGIPDSAPVILKGRAAAVFAHGVMGHRLEGDDQKNASSGQTLTGKVGQQVISPLITITAEPTLKEFNQEPLRGYYEYDDEGVKAQAVTLIEKGILKNFMMKSSPIEGFSLSNGHGRKSIGLRAAARMSVLRVKAEKTISYDELEQKLLAEIKRQNKPYGYIVEDLSGGFTFTTSSMPQSFKLETKMVYKVYPDGKKELVRGLDIVGTPLVSFSRIVAAADDDTIFNGSCGSTSGWVPQSNISPSLLFESMELEKSAKSHYKPPILPAPDVKKEKKK